MLRESAISFGHDLNVSAIKDPSLEAGIPGSRAILAFVDAVYSGIGTDNARRSVLDELGPEALVDACGAYGNFEMMNRVAEGTGIPIPGAAIERQADLIETLGLNRMLKH
ncbi:MAG: hypothetical protein O3B42_09140 [Actinomycetota bacterium]|nr:hypothetical protein [Actinomycetota bacterium]